MAEYLIQDTTAQSIVNKVKIKSGITDEISGSEVEDAIDNILTPTDGSIPTKTSSDLTASGKTVTVPAGYYAANTTKSVSTATQATPSVSVNSSGLITATATQTAGYVSAGTKSGTKQLTTQAAKTVTPSTSSQTAVASGVYTTGAVTVAAVPTQTKAATPKSTSQTISPDSGKFLSEVTVSGDSNLVAENIKSGVSIFGIDGTYEGRYRYLMCDGYVFKNSGDYLQLYFSDLFDDNNEIGDIVYGAVSLRSGSQSIMIMFDGQSVYTSLNNATNTHIHSFNGTSYGAYKMYKYENCLYLNGMTDFVIPDGGYYDGFIFTE